MENIIIEFDDSLQAERYTERLNYMYATIRKFIQANPENKMRNELTKQYKELSIAYGESRFHYDKEHFESWERLLESSRLLLRKAGCTNAHQ